MPTDPRAFAAQSMLQPLQRAQHAGKTKNRLVDFLGKASGKAVDYGMQMAGAQAMGSFAPGQGASNPALMEAAQGGGGPAAPSRMHADRTYAWNLWGKK